MKIYTKTGDTGQTSLYGGTRVSKAHLRIESYGTLDELNSYIGLLKDQLISSNLKDILLDIQDKLFIAGAILATPPEKELLKNGTSRLNIQRIEEKEIEILENHIDNLEKDLPQMTHFILPGGHTTVSFCHIARCICRRAERIVVLLNENEAIDPVIMIYLNRLSDLLFVMARKLTSDLAVEEIKWIPKQK
jgi:cob(I)alamin adenosyltransferase